MYASLLSLAVIWYTYKEHGMVFGGRKMRVSLFPFLTLHAWVCTTQLCKDEPRRKEISSVLHLLWLWKPIPHSVPCTRTKGKKYFGMIFWLKPAQFLKCGTTIWKVIGD